MTSQTRVAGVALGFLGISLGLAFSARGAEKVGARVERTGDEIIVAGQLFHTTAPVVTWMDPGGYDAYRVERRFVALDKASWEETEGGTLKSPNRYGMRAKGLSPEAVEQVRGGGWELDKLRAVVDQFVIHYDVAGTSKRCFQTLHDARGLSVHFMLDLDGTIYQTLDLKERAWHATIANDRSIGIEIANIGAYSRASSEPLAAWYKKGDDGLTRLTIPGGLAQSGQRDQTADLRPSRNEPVVGEVQGKTLTQYDLTPQQYESLIKLTATLCTLFPRITCDYPRDAAGQLVTHKLDDAVYKGYHGLLGHYHVQTNKTDPGPAFQWDKLVNGVKALMAE